MTLLSRYCLHMTAVLALTLTLPGLSPAWAEVPGRVARLSEFAGDVQLANEREDWHPISRNFAVTAGDNVWVSDGGRAELDVGAIQVWLSGGANVYFEQFDDQSLVARLAQGSMAVRIRAWDAQDALRIITQQGEVAPLQPGFYVINAGGAYAPTSLGVRSGQAEVIGGGPAQLVNRGETVVLDGIGVRFDSYGTSAIGGFEAWAISRDRRIERWESRYAGSVSPWMIGARDLDEYGSWSTQYEYGRVWFPTTVAANWAPYRFGRWSWVQPWGWTWVDDAPWGFAPFHYGRWVRVGGRWGWSPGEYVARPVYAPALVTFFGGNGWSISASTGPTFSWVPLGWNEPYVPWYNYSPNYWRQINRPYVRNIAEEPWRPRTYVHASFPGAVTAVPGAAFVGGRPVAQNYIRNVTERDLRSAPPARIGEVLPQRQIQPARGVAPLVGNPPPFTRPGDSNRFPAATGVRERAPLLPNSNVPQPRVWQDPNPVSQPQAPAPRAPLSDNPALRERAVPMPKDRTERGDRFVPRADAPAELRSIPPADRRYIAPSPPMPAPSTPSSPRAITAPPAPTQAQVPAPVPAAPRVTEQRSAPPAVVAPVAPVVPPAPAAPDRARENRPGNEPGRSRDKDRAPTPPPQ
jgi:hypothetical protein